VASANNSPISPSVPSTDGICKLSSPSDPAAVVFDSNAPASITPWPVSPVADNVAKVSAEVAIARVSSTSIDNTLKHGIYDQNSPDAVPSISSTAANTEAPTISTIAANTTAPTTSTTVTNTAAPTISTTATNTAAPTLPTTAKAAAAPPPIRRHFGLKNKFKPNIVAATDRHRNIAAGDLPPPQR
jgi:hypothetical protein